MKSLHIINQPEKLKEALPYFTEDDGVLLIEDAVMIATHDNIKMHPKQYVLLEDLIARGLKGKANADWTLVDYPQFVALTLEYDKSVSWL